MDCPVLHIVIKQDYHAGCIVVTKPKIELKFAWYAMRMCKYYVILVTSNLESSVVTTNLILHHMMCYRSDVKSAPSIKGSLLKVKSKYHRHWYLIRWQWSCS